MTILNRMNGIIPRLQWCALVILVCLSQSCGNDRQISRPPSIRAPFSPDAKPTVGEGSPSSLTADSETSNDEKNLPIAEGDTQTDITVPQEAPNGTESTEESADGGVPHLRPGQTLSWKEILGLDGSHSTSIGSVSAADARLEGGIRFPTRGPGFVLNPARPNRDGRFTTVEVAQAMVRAASAVHRKFPPGKLRIHDFSRLEGGKIPHHGSHRNGRDVDIMFYLLDKESNPVPGKGIVIEPGGSGTDFGDLANPADDVDYTLDVPRTYAFLEALVRDKRAHLQRIFVVEHVRSLLLQYAEQARRPKKARTLIGHLTCQPFTPHDDHIHLRFFCTPQDTALGCTEMQPIYPWQKDYLAQQEVSPVLSIPKRYTDKTRVKKTYQMPPLPTDADKRVHEFWERRAAWVQKPRAGRPYCP